jgi:hypothetical protein
VELFSGYRGRVDTGLSGKNTEKEEIIPGEDTAGMHSGRVEAFLRRREYRIGSV